RRPSNRASRLTLPLGPSNSYSFWTAIHGIRRRSAASASRERVKAFSLTRSCCRAASHSCADTIGGVFIAICTFGRSLSLSLLAAISFLLCFLKQTETTRSEKFSELAIVISILNKTKCFTDVAVIDIGAIPVSER